jgi:glutamate-5-semialdehyde dehydrogenase
MGGILRPLRWAWNAGSEPIFRRTPPQKDKKDKQERNMSVAPITGASTQEKLLRARAASVELALMSTEEKNALLQAIAGAIESNEKSILGANREDVENSGLEGAMRDRLLLTSSRIEDMARGVREVAALPDPIGETLAEWTKLNGLRIRKVRVPLGVVGIIYESRPNVTVDTATLALKSGNAIVLRGGKEAARSSQRLVEIMSAVPGLPKGAIELLDSSTRQSVQELIKARGLVDVIIPRGGAGLITFVTENSAVPVIETGAGNCHIFVDESADFDMADRIVINAKTQRPSVCNAAEKLLVHERIAAEYVPRIVKKLVDAGVEVRGDNKSRTLAVGLHMGSATEQDWYEEYLRLCMAVAVVESVENAISHINRYSTKHSDSIVTHDEANARKFMRGVDSAAVYWNASTRFTDGAEFGFGAEMGISTQKLHCRGPFALAELTSSKYEVIGTGQVR